MADPLLCPCRCLLQGGSGRVSCHGSRCSDKGGLPLLVWVRVTALRAPLKQAEPWSMLMHGLLATSLALSHGTQIALPTAGCSSASGCQSIRRCSGPQVAQQRRRPTHEPVRTLLCAHCTPCRTPAEPVIWEPMMPLSSGNCSCLAWGQLHSLTHTATSCTQIWRSAQTSRADSALRVLQGGSRRAAGARGCPAAGRL